MNPDTFAALEPLLDQVNDLADKHLASPEFQQLLLAMSEVVGKGHSVSINLIVDLGSVEKQQAIPLLNMGLSVYTGKEPLRTWNDSSMQKYVVDDGMQLVPNDRCPKCWQEWLIFKFQDSSCSHWGAALGKDVKLLLDTDECPWCQEGKVTSSDPRCDQCGFEIDPKTVVWG